ncbi:vascular endothelial growth factor receptor 3 isoform X3 [Paramormyrops kingsleyae]|uniref:Vascular endothelial growth factor receptor 3 n=1 Tax=Paramormyrops kingsleyae TaxID=1676925 RepID=A0A3B3S2U9_9TELE|nr:vascular endothelial growth factor receptor 3 isoform X3 [Paramormyrops kingsleyae]
MKRDFTLFCWIWIGIACVSGLVTGYSMTPPTLDSQKDDILINANDTLTITCRGQRTLDWAWPEKSLSKQEVQDRQDQLKPSLVPDHRAIWIRECQGESGNPYCKSLVLTSAQSRDTGYYQCFYRDIKAVVEGTTAVSIYVFVRDVQEPFVKRYNYEFETILVARSSPTILVPCTVSVPDMNVTLHQMPSQVGNSLAPLDDDGITWDNKKGWSVPSGTFLNRPHIFGFFCRTISSNVEHKSPLYLVHFYGSKLYNFKLFPEETVELIVGDALILNCTGQVEFNTGVNIQWAYPGKLLNRTVSLQSERTALSHVTEVSSIFSIRSVNMTDTGLYVCNATSMETKMEHSVKVIVHEKPFISVDYKTGPVVEATAGQKIFKLSVRVSAYPSPETQWYKDGKLINKQPEFNRMKYQQHSLDIREVCQQDAGNYTLVLKNSAALLERRISLSLLVNVPPRIHEKEAVAPTHPYQRGSRQTLTCTAYGVPAPSTITWQWRPWGPCGPNGPLRSPDQRGTSVRKRRERVSHCQDWQDMDSEDAVNAIENIDTWTEMVDGRNKTVSKVVIQNASESAMYKCAAANKVGRDEMLIYFYVTTIPEGFGIELLPTEEPLEMDQVRLRCSADNYTYENLRWYRLDPQALQNETGKPPELDCKSIHLYAEELRGELSFEPATSSWVLELVLPNIQLEHEGSYVCKTQNRRSGEKHCHRKYILVKALEAPRYRHNPTNQTVNISETLLMKCDVEGTPTPQLSWLKDNQPLHQISGILLQDSNRTLSIQRVREEDAGLYTCTACNQRGCIQTSATVSVVGSDDKTNVEVVILIGTGVIAVFFWFLLILIFCNVKRTSPADIKTGYLSIIMDPGEVPLEDQCEYLPYDSSQWEVPRDRLRLGKVLGHGAFGKVIEASAFGIARTNTLETVAVKMLKEGATASEHKALMSELKILIHIGNHLNVVNLLGACTKPNGPLMVIVEYCKYGNLSNYLRAKREFFLPYRDRSPKTRNQVRRMMEAVQVDQRGDLPPRGSSQAKHNQNPQPSPDKVDDLWKAPLTVEDLICYSFQVARGMEFLASRKCIHRDLAARNILLSESNVVKICDFGLARDIYKDPDYVRKGNVRLPLKWMAPESIFDKVYTTQSDVWSFGVLLWEIFSLGASPYPGVQIDEDFCKRLKDGTRMRAPDNASPEIYRIMLACWQGEPRERPTFPALVEILGDMLQDSGLPDGKDYTPLDTSQSLEDDGFSQVSSRPPSEEELPLACNTLPIRYYNCVPFAGCVMTGPSKAAHTRVKTFEEYSLEATSYNTHHDNQTDSGMVLASEEFERIEHKHRGVLFRSQHSARSADGAAGSGPEDRHRPPFLSQLSGQTFYNNEYGQLSEEGLCHFFSVPSEGVLEGSRQASSHL